MSAASRLDRRRARRIRKRIPCEFEYDGRRHYGVVIDVSERGVFVRTSEVVPPGTELQLTLKETAASPAMQIDARVARGVRVPAQLVGQASGGIGMRVLHAPPAFDRLPWAGVSEEKRTSATPNPATTASAPLRHFRVRLTRPEGNRSRVLEIQAPEESAARRAALAQTGSGWEILEIRVRTQAPS